MSSEPEKNPPPGEAKMGAGCFSLPGHFPALDGLRGIAILLVVFLHSGWFPTTAPIDHFWRAIVGVGWCGVDLFFVLSGFLITGILIDAKGGNRYFRNFYARRTLRIFPLYFGFLFCYCIVAPRLGFLHFQTPEAYVQWAPFYWFFLANFPMTLAGVSNDWGLAIFWTLAIEEQFYLLWPAIVWLCSRERLAKICLGMIIGALLTRVIMLVCGASWSMVHGFTPARMDTLAAGALAAVLLRGKIPLPKLKFWSNATGWSMLLLLAILAIRGHFSYRDKLMQEVGYGALAIFFATVVFGAASATRGMAYRLLCNSVLRFFGKYSYGIYIFHCAVIVFFRDRILPDRILPPFLGATLPWQILFHLTVLGLSVALAVLSWHCYEKHFLKLKRFFPMGKKPRRESPEFVLARPVN